MATFGVRSGNGGIPVHAIAWKLSFAPSRLCVEKFITLLPVSGPRHTVRRTSRAHAVEQLHQAFDQFIPADTAGGGAFHAVVQVMFQNHHAE